jgi:hypothetical protein
MITVINVVSQNICNINVWEKEMTVVLYWREEQDCRIILA